MKPARGLDLAAIGEALGPDVRGSAELRPWLPRLAPATGADPFGGTGGPGEPGFLAAALLEARDGAHALELWRRIRALGPALGALPVVVGSAEDVKAIEARFEQDETAKAGERLATDLERAVSGEAGAPGAFPGLDGISKKGSGDALERVEEVEGVVLSSDEMATRDEPFLFQDELREQAFVALVPETSPPLVLAHLRFAGAAAVRAGLVAAIRRWQTRVGPLEVVFAGAATLELERLAQAPTRAEDVRALALEHAFVCPALVEQGSGTLAKLVRQLAGSRRWAFWWD